MGKVKKILRLDYRGQIVDTRLENLIAARWGELYHIYTPPLDECFKNLNLKYVANLLVKYLLHTKGLDYVDCIFDERIHSEFDYVDLFYKMDQINTKTNSDNAMDVITSIFSHKKFKLTEPVYTLLREKYGDYVINNLVLYTSCKVDLPTNKSNRS